MPRLRGGGDAETQLEKRVGYYKEGSLSTRSPKRRYRNTRRTFFSNRLIMHLHNGAGKEENPASSESEKSGQGRQCCGPAGKPSSGSLARQTLPSELPLNSEKVQKTGNEANVEKQPSDSTSSGAAHPAT